MAGKKSIIDLARRIIEPVTEEGVRAAREARAARYAGPAWERMTPDQRQQFMSVGEKHPISDEELMRQERGRRLGFGGPWYHGADRTDRIVEADMFDPKRATSGPMAFFTRDPEMASRYAKGKADTSLARDDEGNVADYFTVAPRDIGMRGRSPIPVERSWHFLPQETRDEITRRAMRVGYANPSEATGPLTLHPEGVEATLSPDHLRHLLGRSEHRGNALSALRDMWLDSGELLRNESALEDVFRLAGYPAPISQATAPWTSAPGVVPVMLRMQNPLVTSNHENLVENVVPHLEQLFARDRTRLKPYGADMWDKEHRYTPRDWTQKLKEDALKGENSFAFTSIPDKVTGGLRGLGYDSILDTGGKMGGELHDVAIPFDPQQVRSIHADFDPAKLHETGLMKAEGGSVEGEKLLEDEYPSHYLPGVGRQVMRDGGAPAINQLTAQLLRYGWTAPKLDYLKQVPRQGFEDGGVASALQAIQNTVGAPRARPQFTAADMVGTSNWQGQNPGAYTDAGGQKVAAPYVSSMRGGYPVFDLPKPAQPTQQANPFLGWLKGLFGGGYAAGGGVQGEVGYMPEGETQLPPIDVGRPHEIHHAELPDISISPSRRHDFVRGQLDSGEPQLPQYDRAAKEAWQDLGFGLMRSPLYAVPGVGQAMAGYDLADSARDLPEVMETAKGGHYGAAAIQAGLDALALGGLGGAGKIGRAALGAGLAANAMTPAEAQAGPAAKALEVARRLSPFGHYSPAAEAVAGVKQQKGRVLDFLNAIRGRLGVTAAELEHSGVGGAFAPDQSVTRDELADYFHSRLPGIEERIYGGAPLKYKPEFVHLEDVHGDEVPDWKAAHYNVGPKDRKYTIEETIGARAMAPEFYLRGPKDDNLGDYRTLDEAVQAAHDALAGRDPAKFQEYALPGGEGYREVVMHLPPNGPGGNRGFESQHWAEPNVLAHLRMSDRTTPISSETSGEILRRITEAIGASPDKLHTLGSGAPGAAVAKGAITPEEAAYISRAKGWRSGYEDKPGIEDKVLHLDEIQSDWGQKGRDEGFNDIPAGPYVTDTNQWTDLALKRALKEAAEGGYDKMVWTPGAEHADRYNLAKHVNHIQWSPENNVLVAANKRGENIIRQEVPSEKLSNFIGKDAAKRLLENKMDDLPIHELKGEDLSFGGHGMTEYYDKLVPTRLQKLIKKLDPEAKMELFSHDLPTERGETIKGHTLHLTPALREAIKKGLPAFKDGGTVRKALSTIARYRDPKSTFIKDWKWRPLRDVQADVGTNIVPEHVQSFGRYMADISDKASTEGLDPEDLIKAYMITRSSIQREGRAPAKLAQQGALMRETDEPLIRPEGQMAEWLKSPIGGRFLNDARRGDLSQDAVEAAMKVMKPFGMSKAEPDAMDWARRNLPEQTPLVSDLVARARAGESSPDEWRAFTKDVRGIGPAKTGFIASLLGRGDLPTLDARQAILHTGMKNADVQDIMQKRSGRVGSEAVDRLAARQRAMGFELPEELDPFYQHLAHHTVWDAVGNEKTTHQDIIDAMKPRAGGGRAVAKAAKALAEKVQIPLDEAYSRVNSLFGGDDEGVQKAQEIVRGWQVPDSPKSGGYYTINQSRPVSEITREIFDIPGLTLKTPRPMSWEDFYDQAKGGSIINIGGDRSDFGRLTGINGRRLPWAVDLHAGPKYALEPSPGSVWANAPGPATGFKNAVSKAAESGPVYGILSPMGPRAVTSSHNMAETLLSQIYGNIADRTLLKKNAREFDKRLRSGEFAAVAKDQDKYVQAMKDWPGLENAKEASDFLRGQSGTMRRDFADYMDSKTWRDAGFPMVGETRAAITDPELLFMPSNAMGHRVVRFDPENITPKSTTFEHSTYPIPTGGEYVGDLPALPRQYVMPTATQRIMQTLAANGDVIHPMSSGNLGRSSARKLFEEQKLLQPIDEDFLAGIRLGEEHKKAYGFRGGGSVVGDALTVVSRARRAA